MFHCRLAYFCADCAGKAKVQTKSLQLCDEENTVIEGKRHGAIKVSILIKYVENVKVVVLSCMTIVVTRPRGGWVRSPVLGVEEEWAMLIKSDNSRQSPWLDENLTLY
jgi:hypothetical protein